MKKKYIIQISLQFVSKSRSDKKKTVLVLVIAWLWTGKRALPMITYFSNALLDLSELTYLSQEQDDGNISNNNFEIFSTLRKSDKSAMV